ncbi:hypothetical protein HRbin06_00926 [archaeon HR06]|nr:hypothetical protein HRbin06_00926 [archaeon HR06]
MNLLNREFNKKYLIIALDHREVALGLLSGTHLSLLDKFSSNFEGKIYYKVFNKEFYFKSILKSLKDFENYDIILVGPGNLKREFSNFLKRNLKKNEVTILDGIDLAGEDGVLQAIKHPRFREIIKGSKLERAYSIMEEALRRLAIKDDKVIFSLDLCLRASDLGAIDSLLISDRIFQKNLDEDILIELVSKVEKSKGEVYLLDYSTDLGIQVDSLGGALALLRFPITS